MNKNKITLVLTKEQLEKIRTHSFTQQVTISKEISETLKNWYIENKNNLNLPEDDNNPQVIQCLFDEETEKIYSLFIQNSMNSLVKYSLQNHQEK